MLVWSLWRQENQLSLFGFCLCSENTSPSSSRSNYFPQTKRKKERKKVKLKETVMNLWSYSDPKFLFGFFFLTMLELQHSRFCNWHFQHRQHLLTFCCLLGCFPPTWLQSPGMSSSVLCFVGVSICCKIWCGFLQLLRCSVSHFLFCSGWFSIWWFFWSAAWAHF